MSNSLVGSLDSDKGEHIRRATDSPPVNMGREIMGLEKPASAARSVGVGEAHSVLNIEFGSGGNGRARGGRLIVTAYKLWYMWK